MQADGRRIVCVAHGCVLYRPVCVGESRKRPFEHVAHLGVEPIQKVGPGAPEVLRRRVGGGGFNPPGVANGVIDEPCVPDASGQRADMVEAGAIPYPGRCGRQPRAAVTSRKRPFPRFS